MQPTKKTLSELFGQPRLHVIPLFQRPYVWSLEKQWEPLWQDIEERALAVLDQMRQGPRGPLPAHFLGAIVTSQVRTYGLEIDRREVIDGQQRLTTLQVFLAAFRDYLADKNATLHGALSRLTENAGVPNPEERNKLWPTNADREVYVSVMTARSPDVLETAFPLRRRKWKRQYDPRPPLVEAYLFFHRSIARFCCATDTNGEAAYVDQNGVALFETVGQHVQVVHIDLEENDDPQVIFETLNARGEPLLPSDLLRNFVFLRANRQKKDFVALYETWWKDYDERVAEDDDDQEPRFWKRSERQGRLLRPRLDVFFFHYLQLLTGREVAIGHLYQEFRKWWDSNGGGERDVEVELREMRRLSDGFAALFVPSGHSREASFARRLKALDTSTVYPVVLFLLVHSRERVLAADLPAILGDIESYLVRRLITRATTKNYNRFFLALLAQLRNVARIDRSFVRGYLANATGDSAWPDDRAFERAWHAVPAYLELGAARVAMVLEALERQMKTSKQEGLPVPEVTVEHILPQEWEANWPAPVGLSDPEDEDVLAWRNRLLHTFGNLTLLAQPLNSSVSNGSFAAKRPAIALQSELRLNTYFQNQLARSEEDITQRAETLFAVARQVWPGPN